MSKPPLQSKQPLRSAMSYHAVPSELEGVRHHSRRKLALAHVSFWRVEEETIGSCRRDRRRGRDTFGKHRKLPGRCILLVADLCLLLQLPAASAQCSRAAGHIQIN